jgi:hypothetical protein
MPLRAFGVQLKIELVAILGFAKRLRAKRSSPEHARRRWIGRQ